MNSSAFNQSFFQIIIKHLKPLLKNHPKKYTYKNLSQSFFELFGMIWSVNFKPSYFKINWVLINIELDQTFTYKDVFSHLNADNNILRTSSVLRSEKNPNEYFFKLNIPNEEYSNILNEFYSFGRVKFSFKTDKFLEKISYSNLDEKLVFNFSKKASPSDSNMNYWNLVSKRKIIKEDLLELYSKWWRTFSFADIIQKNFINNFDETLINFAYLNSQDIIRLNIIPVSLYDSCFLREYIIIPEKYDHEKLIDITNSLPYSNIYVYGDKYVIRVLTSSNHAEFISKSGNFSLTPVIRSYLPKSINLSHFDNEKNVWI